MKTAVKTIVVFLFFAVLSNAALAQNNYLILNSRMPMHTESASTLKQGELQWGLGLSAESRSYKTYLEPRTFVWGDPRPIHVSRIIGEDRYSKDGIFKLDYGVFDKLQIGLYMAAALVQYGHDHHMINLKYNVNSDEKIFPSFSLSTAFDGYFGDIAISDFSFKAMLSKSFDKFRVHLNLVNYNPRSGLVSPGRKFDAGGAVDYNLSGEKLLLIGEDFINSIPDTRYEYRIGAKKQLYDDFLFYGSVGTSVSKMFHPVYHFNIGMTWYGIGLFKELI